MRLVSFIPTGTRIDFMRWRRTAGMASIAFVVLSAALFLGVGLNYGIDFRGGILVEIRTEGPADIGALRSQLSTLDLGEVELQEFGEPTDVLIRIERQTGAEREQLKAVEVVKQALGPGVDYRRVEFVGPKVGAELIEAGITAVLLALGAMLIYIWFRFEWQFGVGAVVALMHDVILTIGIFSLLGLEFNLSTVAAVLTIAGYSINDTVVIYDRVRENLRKYKTLPIDDLLNLSVNDTLSRTILTSVTTLLALFCLFFFGGQVIKGFSFAMIWGVLVGTYSSIWVAVPLLVYMKLKRGGLIVGEVDDEGHRLAAWPSSRRSIRRAAASSSPMARAGSRISGEVFTGSVIVLVDTVRPWPEGDAGRATIGGLAAVVDADPAVEILLLGTGTTMRPLEPELRAALRERGIVCDAMDTGAACRSLQRAGRRGPPRRRRARRARLRRNRNGAAWAPFPPPNGLEDVLGRGHRIQHRDRQHGVGAREQHRAPPCRRLRVVRRVHEAERDLLRRPDDEPDVEPHDSAEPHADADLGVLGHAIVSPISTASTK